MSGLRLLMMLCAYSTMFCPILPHLGPKSRKSIANWLTHCLPADLPMKAMKKAPQGFDNTSPDWELLFEPRCSFLRELYNSRESLRGAMHPPALPDWKVTKKAMKKAPPMKKPMKEAMKMASMKKAMKKRLKKPMKAMRKAQ